jgi:hypothetical protein
MIKQFSVLSMARQFWRAIRLMVELTKSSQGRVANRRHQLIVWFTLQMKLQAGKNNKDKQMVGCQIKLRNTLRWAIYVSLRFEGNKSTKSIL